MLDFWVEYFERTDFLGLEDSHKLVEDKVSRAMSSFLPNEYLRNEPLLPGKV